MRKKNILVTGSSGLLGSVFLSMPHHLYSISTFPLNTDIANTEDVGTKLEGISPDIILHAAAYTDVDGCELNPDKATKVNVLGTENILDYCSKHDKKIIYISSTGVYGDNQVGAFSEKDRASPTTVHHCTKLSAEKLVLESPCESLILRVGWLYGGSISNKNNFVYKRYLEAVGNTVIYSSCSQKGNPTNVHDVVSQIHLLLENGQTGIFNCVNAGTDVTRYDYVSEIVRLFELDCKVAIATPGMFKRIAPVSSNESAKNQNLDSIGLNIMGPWNESLAKYIRDLKFYL
jgi:dTDP-4-dehydrorhamnose reductase